MDKDLALFYLNKIETKIKMYILQQSESLRNDLLMYLEICIEVCNLIERRFYQKVDIYRNIFCDIQGLVLLKDMANALNTIFDKKKELENSSNASSSK